MSILKALQKKQIEETTGGEESPKGMVLPFERVDREKVKLSKPPELFVDNEFKIGTPSSAFNGQSESLIRDGTP